MILHLILSLILSIETIIIIDFAMVLKGIHFKLSLYGISLLSQFILLAFCSDTPNILLFTLAHTVPYSLGNVSSVASIRKNLTRF